MSDGDSQVSTKTFVCTGTLNMCDFHRYFSLSFITLIFPCSHDPARYGSHGHENGGADQTNSTIISYATAVPILCIATLSSRWAPHPATMLTE
jgi:hypothetical protein